MYGKLKDFLTQELANIKAAGLYKNERSSPLLKEPTSK